MNATRLTGRNVIQNHLNPPPVSTPFQVINAFVPLDSVMFQRMVSGVTVSKFCKYSIIHPDVMTLPLFETNVNKIIHFILKLDLWSWRLFCSKG